MTDIRYIEVDETHRIEIMPSGNHYPQHLINPQWKECAEGWAYYRTGGFSSQERRFKMESGARKFIANQQ